jgi:glucose-6-phosphate-specific signal transduction histidine kinase
MLENLMKYLANSNIRPHLKDTNDALILCIKDNLSGLNSDQV